MDFWCRSKALLSRLVCSLCLRRPLPADDAAHLIWDTPSVEFQEDITPFRFLDLPPELRIPIYEHLLLMCGRHGKCQPQILATCSLVNNEAHHILYEHNHIFIDIDVDGVRTQGILSSPYTPAQRFVESGIRTMDLTAIVWPEFLRRVRRLHVSSPLQWHRPPPRATGILGPIPPNTRMAAIGNILYSLCTYLRPEHHDSLSIEAAFTCPGPEDLKTALYPMRFLGFTDVAMPFTKGGPASIFFDKTAYLTARSLRSHDLMAKIAILWKCKKVLTEVAIEHGSSRKLKLLSTALAASVLMGAVAVGRVDPDTGEHCYDSARILTNTIKFAVLELRILLESSDVLARDESLQELVHLLLRVDVELRTSPTSGKRENTTRNARLLEHYEQPKSLVTAG